MIKSFSMRLPGTRKLRSWVAYASATAWPIVIQSDDAIGEIYPDDTGKAIVKANGAYFPHLILASKVKYPDGTYTLARSCQPASCEHLGNGVYQS